MEALQPLLQWETSRSVNGSSTGGAKEQDRIVTHPADAQARPHLKGLAGVPQQAASAEAAWGTRNSARAEMTGFWINHHPTIYDS